MDDMLAAGDNLENALKVKAQTKQLQTGGFQLSKIGRIT